MSKQNNTSENQIKKARVYYSDSYIIDDAEYKGYVIEIYDAEEQEWILHTFFTLLEDKFLPKEIMEVLEYIQACGFNLDFKHS